MCTKLILATNNVLREKAAISCGLVDAWVQFPDRATTVSVLCNVQSGSEFCPACCPVGTGAHFEC